MVIERHRVTKRLDLFNSRRLSLLRGTGRLFLYCENKIAKQIQTTI